MPKKIPYAVAHFEKLIEGQYHFVDKTAFLHQLETWQAPVFPRPRRFGKSLWCSLMECYYDVNRGERFDSLFGGLEIGANPTPERNKYLVLRFDFSVVDVKDNLTHIQ